METHTCSKCKVVKDVSEFGWNKKRNKPNYWCKSCRVSYNKENDKKHTDRIKAQRVRTKLQYRYGLTPELVLTQLQQQHYKCAICSNEISISTKHVDHCHKTGNIRGLLCAKCNKGIGLFSDNTTVLKNAIKYIESEGVWN